MNRLSLVAIVMTVGCSEYSLNGKGKDPALAPSPDTEEPTEPTPEEAPEQPVTPSCADVAIHPWAWQASEPFPHLEDPVDAIGRPFWDPDAALGWAPITLPDRAVPIGDDRAYVSTFELEALPTNLWLNLQSDDGLWVWVNGTYVGNWGGDWQEEGCVNENAECLVTTDVPPVLITDLLVVGTNHIAARLSNPVASSYFEILPECVDP
jgi:hypothetical protein